jgi:hypothetical protein
VIIFLNFAPIHATAINFDYHTRFSDGDDVLVNARHVPHCGARRSDYGRATAAQQRVMNPAARVIDIANFSPMAMLGHDF